MLNIESLASNPGVLNSCSLDTGMLKQRRPLSLLIFDLNSLTFLSVNDTAVQKYGYARDEFLGMSMSDILQTGRTAQFFSYTRGTAKALMSTSVWKHHKKDGTSMDMEMMCCKFTFLSRQAMLALADEITVPTRPTGSLASDLPRQDNWINRPRGRDMVSRVERRLTLLELNRELDLLVGMADEAHAGQRGALLSAHQSGVYPRNEMGYRRYRVTSADGSTEYYLDSQPAAYLPGRRWAASLRTALATYRAELADAFMSLHPRVLRWLQAYKSWMRKATRGNDSGRDEISE
jgi:hypothetical protein